MGKANLGFNSELIHQHIIDSMDMNLSKLWEIVEDRLAWHTAIHGVAKSWTRLCY